MIQKIIKLSDFPLLNKLLTKGKTILAYDKKNFYAELGQLKGDQITNIEEIEANKDAGQRANVIRVDFNNSKSKYFVVYNGEDGDKGNKGIDGEQGLKGNSFNKNEMINRVGDALVIANDDVTNDPTAVWSAYRGKVLYEFLKSIAETIVTDDEYQLLFNEQVFIDMEFTTKSNAQTCALVHNDNKEYKTYIKYWTYEDEGSEEYYVKVGNVFTIVNDFDIWDDYFLNPDNNETYYTRKLVITETDPVTGDVISSEYQYTEIVKPVWLDLEFTSNIEDQTSNILHSRYGDDDPDDISKDEKEEEIVIIHRPITSITIDGNGSSLDNPLIIPINSILTKAINIQPTNYLNSPICIEYDDEKIEVFEDGRIMALENNCNTIIKIYSQESPSIYANIYVNVITYVDAIQFNTSSIRAFEGISTTIDYTVLPETASNKSITWSSSNPDVVSVDQNGTITLNKAGHTATIYAEANDGSGVISRIDITIDVAVENILFPDAKTITDENENEIQTLDVLVGIPTVINATVQPENASNKQLSWTSDNNTISIGPTADNINGQIFLSSKIEDVISIKAIDGSNVEKRLYIIGKIPVRELTLNMNTATIDLGDTLQLEYTINENADNKDVIWESSNENILTVDQNGLVRGVSGGDATVTIKALDGSGMSASCNIISVVLITDITFTQKNIELHVGSTYAFIKNDNYTITPNNANVTKLNWYTSDESIATITNDGTITAINEGKVKVYAAATDNSGIIASADIIVTIPSSELLLSDYNLTLNVDQTYTLVATVIPDNTSLQYVEFTSLDPDIATVDENGNITAVSSGETSIFVKTLDTNISDKCDIIVL